VYLDGEGLKRDQTEALAWFIVAEARVTVTGRTADERRTFAQSRDDLIRALSPDRIAAARQRAAALLAKMYP
jgi:hypothetical protein